MACHAVIVSSIHGTQNASLDNVQMTHKMTASEQAVAACLGVPAHCQGMHGAHAVMNT